jgi:hypothetical protein
MRRSLPLLLMSVYSERVNLKYGHEMSGQRVEVLGGV